MSTDKLTLTIDRIEGSVAVLVSDAGASYEVGRSALPAEAREGTVLIVGGDASGIDWSSARVDADEKGRRVDRAEEALAELRRRDPGGDIQL